MAYGTPRAGDQRVSGPLSAKQAEILCREAAETITRMGHGKNIGFYVAKFGSSHAVFRSEGEKK